MKTGMSVRLLGHLRSVAIFVLRSPASPSGAAGDPLFVFPPEPPPPRTPPLPPPTGEYFEGPCGLAYDRAAVLRLRLLPRRDRRLHREHGVPGPDCVEVDPLDGPCWARLRCLGESLRQQLPPRGQEVRLLSQLPGRPVIDTPTRPAVAVDPATGDVYVDERTQIAVYDPAGAPRWMVGEPLKIGWHARRWLRPRFLPISGHARSPLRPRRGDRHGQGLRPRAGPSAPVATIDGSPPAGRLHLLARRGDRGDNGQRRDLRRRQPATPRIRRAAGHHVTSSSASGAYRGPAQVQRSINALATGPWRRQLRARFTRAGSTSPRATPNKGAIYAYGPALRPLTPPLPPTSLALPPRLGGGRISGWCRRQCAAVARGMSPRQAISSPRR